MERAFSQSPSGAAKGAAAAYQEGKNQGRPSYLAQPNEAVGVPATLVQGAQALPSTSLQAPAKKRVMYAECFFIPSNISNYQGNVSNYLQSSYGEIFQALELHKNHSCKNFKPQSCTVRFEQEASSQCQLIIFNEDIHSTRKQAAEFQQIALSVELEIIQNIAEFKAQNYDLKLLDEAGFACLGEKDTGVFITILKRPVLTQAKDRPQVMALPPTRQEMQAAETKKEKELAALTKEKKEKQKRKDFKEAKCCLKTLLCCGCCLAGTHVGLTGAASVLNTAGGAYLAI